MNTTYYNAKLSDGSAVTSESHVVDPKRNDARNKP